MVWDFEAARMFCYFVEHIANQCGAHVALTGGTLYKDGKRKDLDIMFYRHKVSEPIDMIKLKTLMELEDILWNEQRTGRVHKALFMKRYNIDMFFPMEPEYTEEYPKTEAIEFE